MGQGARKLLASQGLLGNLLEQLADPLLLLFLRLSQEQQVLGQGHVIVHPAWYDGHVLLVQVFLVALGVAAAALQSGWGLEHVPEGFGAGFTGGREVVESWDKLVALVTDAVGLV